MTVHSKAAMMAMTLFATALTGAPQAYAKPMRTGPVASVVEPFFEAVAREDLVAVQKFITPDSIVQAMFNPNGQNGAAHIRSFPATAYFAIVTRNYENIVFSDRIFSVSRDGRTVWMEAQGNLIVAATGKPYRNGYVFKLTLENGKIKAIQEWVNTVTLTQQGLSAGVPAR